MMKFHGWHQVGKPVDLFENAASDNRMLTNQKELFLRQALSLQEHAPGAVEHDDPLVEKALQLCDCVRHPRSSRLKSSQEPDARGLGVGGHLVDELIAFAREAGYHAIRLWTQSVLLAARRIYARAGFRLIAEEPHHSFGHDLVAETWELRL